jgi:hypothetical protein
MAVATGLVLAVLFGVDARAGGFFESLFGPTQGSAEAPYSRPAAPLPYADPTPPNAAMPAVPGLLITVPPPTASAGTASFCVRTCDGRYFPVQRHANLTPIQACSAMCPAAKTKIFSGSEIGQARAADGSRYDDLDNAYVYRSKLVDNCTCNGKTAFGLAPIEVVNDPTLKAGDMVATETGVVKFTGSPMQLRKSIGLAPEPPQGPQRFSRRKFAADLRGTTR